jgi:hypothetical protein
VKQKSSIRKSFLLSTSLLPINNSYSSNIAMEPAKTKKRNFRDCWSLNKAPTWDAEAGESRVGGQYGQQKETLLQNKNKKVHSN